MQKIEILGVKVSLVTDKEVVEWVRQWVGEWQREQRKKRLIVTPNPEQIVMSQKDEQFKRILNQADLAIPDGVGLVWASRWLFWRGKVRAEIKARVAGADVAVMIFKQAKKEGWRVFLLGGRQGVAGKVARLWQREAGEGDFKVDFFEGAWQISRESDRERRKVLERINQFRPDILLVAYGAPWQEKWVSANLKHLQVGVVMVVGGAFDYLAGKMKRASVWWQQIGLEWLWRLWQEPWRWRRQLRLLEFVWRIVRGGK